MSKNAIGVALVLAAGLIVLSGCALSALRPNVREQSLSREEALDILARNSMPPEVEPLVRVQAKILMKMYGGYGLSYRDAFEIAAMTDRTAGEQSSRRPSTTILTQDSQDNQQKHPDTEELLRILSEVNRRQEELLRILREMNQRQQKWYDTGRFVAP